MGEKDLGDLILLKQKLKDYLDSCEYDKAKKVYDAINIRLKQIGNITLENMMDNEERKNIKNLFNKSGDERE